MIHALADNRRCPAWSWASAPTCRRTPTPRARGSKFGIDGRYVVYVGRIDENKGCKELFAFFERYVAGCGATSSLVLVGNSILPIPDHPRFRHLGFLDDRDKFDLVGGAEALIMPSYFESLSMVALEAWALGRPVLANGKCDVLRGQCARSNAGLYYESFEEFAETLYAIEAHPHFDARARPQRSRLLPPALRVAGDRAEVPRHAEAVGRRRPRGTGRPGDGAASGLVRAAATDVPAGGRGPRRRSAGPRAALAPARPAAIAPAVGMSDGRGTPAGRAPGAGDAGLRRRHRARGRRDPARAARGRVRVGHLRRDRRLAPGAPHARLSRTARRQPPATTSSSTTSRSGRARPAWRTRCPIGWRSSTTTSRRPSTSSGCTRCWCSSASWAAASCAPTSTASRSRSATRSSTGRNSRRPASRRHRGAAGRAELRAPRRRRRAGCSRSDFDDDWVNLIFVGRVIPNKKLDDVIRIFAAYKRHFNPRSRLLFVGSHSGFDLYFAMLQQLIATLRVPDVHFTGHITNEDLTSFYDIADVFVCASEHEGFCVPLMEAFHKGVPVVAYAATAVPATMDGAGILYRDKAPLHVAQPHRRPRRRRRAGRTDRGRARMRRSRACSPRTSRGTLLALRRPGGAVAGPGTPGRGVRLLGPVRRAGSARGAVDRAARDRTRPCRRPHRQAGTRPERGLGRREAESKDDRPPVGPGRAPRRRHRRQRAEVPRPAARARPRGRPVRDDDRRRPAERGLPRGPTRPRGAGTSPSSTSPCRPQ